MPLYEYECEKCGHRFEVIQRFSDDPIEKCPVCGGPVHKMLSAPAIQFKGSGWYITDYARKNTSGPSKPSMEGSSSESSSSSSDASKPAAAPSSADKKD